jgi:hypothetical protein
VNNREISDQDYLIKPMKALGYTSDPGGICEGFVMMGTQAFLSEDYKTFQERINFLIKKRKGIVKLAKSVETKLADKGSYVEGMLTPDEEKVKDARALFEGIELWFQPDHYGPWTGKENVSQGDVETIAPLVASQAIEKKGGLKKLPSWSGIYTLDSLEFYMQALNETASRHNQNMVFKLEGHNHTIALCYDAKQKTWTLIDANQLVHPNVPAELLAKIIVSAFDCNDVVAFETVPFTTGHDKAYAEDFLQDLKQQFDFIKTHELTAEMAALETHDGFSLGHLAAESGNTHLLKELVNEYGIDLNKPNELGVTPLDAAAGKGRVDVIRFAKEKGIDLNQPHGMGLTTAAFAVVMGQTNILKELQSAGVDLNQPIIMNGVPKTLVQLAEEAEKPSVMALLQPYVSFASLPITPLDKSQVEKLTSLREKKSVEREVKLPETKRPPLPASPAPPLPPREIRTPPPLPPRRIASPPSIPPRPTKPIGQDACEKEFAVLKLRIATLEKSLIDHMVEHKKLDLNAHGVLTTCAKLKMELKNAIEVYHQGSTKKLSDVGALRTVVDKSNRALDDKIQQVAESKHFYRGALFDSSHDPAIIRIISEMKTGTSQVERLRERIDKSMEVISPKRGVRGEGGPT